MNNYKINTITFFLCVFIITGCNKNNNKILSLKNIDKQNIDQTKSYNEIDSIKLIQSIWEIDNIKRVKKGKITSTEYYRIFKGNQLIFDKTGALILSNDSIGIWDSKGVIIYKIDSLNNEYNFMQMGGLLQLINTDNEFKNGNYLIINMRNKQFGIQNSKGKVNFDQ